jgi:glycosyltransferase involved in cell wall biosynthesis
MKTLLLAPELFTTNGGIPRILRSYLKALCDLSGPKDQVRFVALNDQAIDPDLLAHYSNERLGTWSVAAGKKPAFVRQVLKLSPGCQRVICGHVGQAPVAWLARRISPGQKYIVVAHGIEVWRKFRLRERLALRGAHRIWCVSEFTKREMLRHLPLPPEKVVVLPNALDPFFRISPGRPLHDCPPVILTVTRLSSGDRYKGVDRLIEAMAAVRTAIPNAQLRIIGQGDDLPRLQALAQQHRLLNAGVEFLGFVDDARLHQEMGSCRLFALPSGREGFGLVFLEAMARGRPCLGLRAGGAPEVIDASSGVLTAPGDVLALATGCVQALRHEWNEGLILGRARQFSYSPFVSRLGSLLKA